MVEILAVLAVIGALSVGGISLLEYALDKHHANEIVRIIMENAVNTSGGPSKYSEFESGDYVFAIDSYGTRDGWKDYFYVFVGDRETWDCYINPDVVKHVFPLLFRVPFVWQLGNGYTYYKTLADFENDFKTNRFFCIEVGFKNNLSNRPTDYLGDLSKPQNPSTCAGQLQDDCNKCEEKEGWPVDIYQMPYKSSCTLEDGFSGICSIDNVCILPPCTEVDCEQKCDGTDHFDSLSGNCLPNSGTCTYNSDCAEGYFCAFPYKSETAVKGECQKLNMPTKYTFDLDGDNTEETAFYMAPQTSSYQFHTAQSYCAAIGKTLFDHTAFFARSDKEKMNAFFATLNKEFKFTSFVTANPCTYNGNRNGYYYGHFGVYGLHCVNNYSGPWYRHTKVLCQDP